jgi:toxin secretion/phage lysis holin
MQYETEIAAVFAIITSAFTALFGSESAWMSGLLILMVADVLTGMVAAIQAKQGLCAQIGQKGLLRKSVVIIFIAALHQVELLFEISAVMQGAVSFYAIMELISITENMGRMGIPLPRLIRELLQKLQEKEK